MKNKQSLFILFILLLTFCGSVSESDDVANQFYESVKAEKFDEVTLYLDSVALNVTPAKIWIKGLKDINNEMGKLINYKRIGFYTNTKNGVTKTTLNFAVTYTNGTLYEKLQFISRENKYKISYYEYSDNRNEIVN